MKQLEAGELSLEKIFATGDFDFVIPDYQRPYAWAIEQTLQLLDDLETSLERNLDEPYFLGSIVLVKEKGHPRAEVIDGQQRLTTTTILMAVLRDLVEDDDVAREMQHFIEQPGKKLTGTNAKPRLRLRARDAAFFRDHVQAAGQVAALVALTDNALKTDAQRAIRDNAKALLEKVSAWDASKRQKLFVMLAERTFLVAVSTPDLASAHRIFSVMNARGLDLSPADIFKAQVIGDVDAADQESYAERWEDAEEDLGRDRFAELFLHVRMIFAKVRAQRELLKEFPEQVLDKYVPGRGAAFVDEVLIPYAEAYEHLVNQDYGPGPHWETVNAWLKRLVQLDNNDWRPAALWALRHHHDDPTGLAAFLRKLERLAASMLLRRSYTTPRTQRYAELLKQLDRGHWLDAEAFELEPQEKQDTLTKLGADIYLVNPVRKYVLLRINELLANVPGVSYDHKIITVEHVLPQTPKVDSEWVKNFTEEQRQLWTHKLGNLLLLNRTKNSQAQNFDFDEKKTKYFSGKTGVTTFALTTQVLKEPQWTPAVVERRQQELVELLAKEWDLT